MIFESFSVILRQISLGVPTVRHRLFSLSYEKILQKSRFLGLCRNARSNFTRSTFVHRRLFSLSYEKILQKSRFWVFSVIQRQISLGVHSYAVVHFPCLTKKSFKNRDFGSFRLYCDKYHSEYIRTPPFIFLVLRKNPPKIEIWVFSEILRQISLGVHSHAVVYFPTERPSV